MEDGDERRESRDRSDTTVGCLSRPRVLDYNITNPSAVIEHTLGKISETKEKERLWLILYRFYVFM